MKIGSESKTAGDPATKGRIMGSAGPDSRIE
jgi:hypothetical protein